MKYNLECKDGWSPFRNKCYLEVGDNPAIESLTWPNARKKCLDVQGELASVPDQETKEFLTKLGNKVSHWIGGQKNGENIWTWTDGTPWNNEFWLPDEPNNEKEMINGIERNQTVINQQESGLWDDKAPEASMLGYFCQTTRYLGTSFQLFFVFTSCFLDNCTSHKKDKIGPFKITLRGNSGTRVFKGSSNEKTFLWTETVATGNYEVMVQTQYGLLPFDKVGFRFRVPKF